MSERRRLEMAVVGARLLKDHERVLVGVGLPNLAANLAKRLHAPNLVLVYESGIIDASPPQLPLSIGDPDLVRTSLCVLPMSELFSQYLQTGWIDVGFLGGAQVDEWGNLNSTVIGDYASPRTRLAGSGGAADIASFNRRTVVLMPHERQRFPARVDFITSPGHEPGKRRPGGPSHVVTDLGLLDFDQDGRMRLVAVHSGVSVAEVEENTGFPLNIASHLTEIPAPTTSEVSTYQALIGVQL
ncbi:MAG: CoA-transferase subunit beta [Candidatus Dormibacteria bacterium]|jgi:glutaconate CoA-transferase subunit B